MPDDPRRIRNVTLPVVDRQGSALSSTAMASRNSIDSANQRARLSPSSSRHRDYARPWPSPHPREVAGASIVSNFNSGALRLGQFGITCATPTVGETGDGSYRVYDAVPGRFWQADLVTNLVSIIRSTSGVGWESMLERTSAGSFARRCGFSGAEHCCRAFRAHLGIAATTPTDANPVGREPGEARQWAA
jgi:hypothetical protein